MKRVPITIEGRQAYIESIAWKQTYFEPDTLDVRITLDEAVGPYAVRGFEINLPAKVYTTRDEFFNAASLAGDNRLRDIIKNDESDRERRDKPVILTRLVDEIKVLIGLD